MSGHAAQGISLRSPKLPLFGMIVGRGIGVDGGLLPRRKASFTGSGLLLIADPGGGAKAGARA